MICRDFASDADGRRMEAAMHAPEDRAKPYGPPFWFAYAANTLAMVAIALLFRYADFVMVLGGTELHLGWIVGVGMFGSLAMRLAMGVGIDRYGPPRVWLASILTLALVCFAHLAVTDYANPPIYLLRILYCCAIAGIFGASITFISDGVPPERIAEMIGMLGTSGFLGQVLGTQVGDLLLGGETIGRDQVDQMFLVAGLLALCSAVFVFLATRTHRHDPHEQPPAVLTLLRQYQPGAVLITGVAMGIGIGLPMVFLRTYAAELGLPRIGLFYGAYAPAALLTRLLTRRWPQRYGTKLMILLGLGLMAFSQLLFLVVRTEWSLIVPAIGYGCGHAVLFPSVIAAGNASFPRAHRGLGTALMLGTFDLGQLVGAPLAGVILHQSGRIGWPSYPTLFVSMAVLLGGIAAVYAIATRRANPPIDPDRPKRQQPADPMADPMALAR